jgi:hypothetical protein
MFKHDESKKPVVWGVPSISISEKAYRDMWNIVDLSDEEVGWMCTVTENKDTDGTISLVIEEVYLPKQQVHAATCELSPDGFAQIAAECDAADRAENKDPNAPTARKNRLQLWGHSHVRMGVTPSSQDDTQFKDFKDSGYKYMLRLICNKNRDMRIDMLIFEYNLKIVDIEWKVDSSNDDPRREHWKTEISSKVSRLSDSFKGGVVTVANSVTAPTVHNPDYGYGGWNPYSANTDQFGYGRYNMDY